MKQVSDVWFNGRVLSLHYDGKVLKKRIMVSEHVRNVGSWKFAPRGSVKIDNDLAFNEGFSTAIHEIVEVYLVRRKGLSEVDAHSCAEEIEANFARKIGLRWKPYSENVERVYRKEQAYARSS